MSKRFSRLLILILIGTLVLTGCGKKAEKDGDTSKQESQEDVNDVDKNVEPEMTEEEKKELEERNQYVETFAGTLDLIDEIVADFDNVRVEGEPRIQLTDDNKNIYTADVYLFLENDNEEEALKIIDEYSETFKKEFEQVGEYEELILYWLTPNHDKSNAIEKLYY